MLTIKFSRHYEKHKLANAQDGDHVQLLAALTVHLQDLHRSFLDYDTDAGEFKIPRTGNYILLLFRARGGIFPTLRSCWPREKQAYYERNVGEYFQLQINLEK